VQPRPFLKWAGGKGQLIQQYQSYFPTQFQTYYEPFLGGAALFFHLCPHQAVLSDVNPELVNVYCCVRDQVEAVIALLDVHQRHHSKTYYYQMRSLTPDSEVERAARLIYLNKTCFNGLYRENSKGEFNVPMGRYHAPTICNPELLRAASAALQSAQIVVRSFESVLESAQTAEAFVYFDPPYYPLSPTSNFTAYNRYAFSAADQIRLRDVFAALSQRGVQVLLSNSDCPFIRDLYQGFTIQPITATRAINSNHTKRGKISEVLIVAST
jgi:DNA adenine methylase